MEMDETDRRILKLLQKDGWLAHAVIAKKVGLTGPSVLARVRRLEDAGVIRGYNVLLDQAALGRRWWRSSALRCLARRQQRARTPLRLL